MGRYTSSLPSHVPLPSHLPGRISAACMSHIKVTYSTVQADLTPDAHAHAHAHAHARDTQTNKPVVGS